MTVSAKILIPFVTLVAGLSCSGCGNWKNNDAFDQERFREVVEQAEADGLSVYWLGRELTITGLTLNEVDPDSTIDGNGRTTSIVLRYVSTLRDEQADLYGTLAVFSLPPSRTGADVARNIGKPPEQFANVDRDSIDVGGVPAELVTVWLTRNQPPSSRHLIIEFPDATVRLSTAVAFADGKSVNPLVDRDNLIAAAERLRPYEE